MATTGVTSTWSPRRCVTTRLDVGDDCFCELATAMKMRCPSNGSRTELREHFSEIDQERELADLGRETRVVWRLYDPQTEI